MIDPLCLGTSATATVVPDAGDRPSKDKSKGGSEFDLLAIPSFNGGGGGTPAIDPEFVFDLTPPLQDVPQNGAPGNLNPCATIEGASIAAAATAASIYVVAVKGRSYGLRVGTAATLLTGNLELIPLGAGLGTLGGMAVGTNAAIGLLEKFGCGGD